MGRHKAAFVTRRPPTGSCAATFSGAYQWAGCWRRLILWLALIWASMPAWASPPVVLVLGDSLSAAYGMDLDDGWASCSRVSPLRVVSPLTLALATLC